ncbi:acyltransferase [Neorhodopirellula lusitana]|uniref:acyltransferase n=1 Tax=Neorhodopirellula lusitana TaxID=445327 RepID=UPI003D2A492B
MQNGAWIGACATILPGVTIGTKALVGAGSLVRTDISSDMVVAGVPARTIRSIASPGINQ